jgi:DMSO/TMAO reductase YedYZ molybdopterin-dependent catalytic subunit
MSAPEKARPEGLARREFLRISLLSCLTLTLGCQRQTNTVVTNSATPSPSPEANLETEFEFIVRNRRPKDLETPVEVFQSYLTPNERFFIRSHHPEPKLKSEDWQLKVEGAPVDVSLDLTQLKSMEKATVTAVLQCAGNSRALYDPKVPGVQWDRGAVGNAEWTGARLADVLEKAGVTDASTSHLVFSGADKPLMKTVPVFAREIPLAKCLHPDTLLAYEMNGQPLPRFHGGPVRLVVPGWVGDDWIKWITLVRLQDEPYDGFYYKTGYRYPTKFGPPGQAVAAENMEPMDRLVTRSLFSHPLAGQSVKQGTVILTGVAWTGGDATIRKVEISDDGGKTWREVTLEGEAKPYAWRLWRADWQAKSSGPVTLLCRATDSLGQTQSVEPSPWNPGGYLWGSADRLDLEVVS